MKLAIENEVLERAVRERAAAEKKSVEAVIIESLARGLGIEVATKRRDLSDIAGHGLITPEIEAALEDQRRIDWEM